MIQSSIGFTRKEVVAENGVVAGGHDLVAQTGVKIMQQGGNAIDAGVAAAFVAQLAEPGMCGVGGNGIICVHSADQGETTVFDDTTVPPAAATSDMFELLPGQGGFYGWKMSGTTPTSSDTNLWRYRGLWRGCALSWRVTGRCRSKTSSPRPSNWRRRRGGGYTRHDNDCESDEALPPISTSGCTLSRGRTAAGAGNLLGTGRQTDVS